MIRILSVALAAACIAACQPAPSGQSPGIDQAAELEALMQISARWSDVSGTGDIDAELAFWADDAVFMPPGTDFLEGKAAIRAFLEEESALENLSIGWSTRSGYVAESGDLAYLVEELRMDFDAESGDRVSVPGKIVTVWRKNGAGEWENVADIYNYNRQ